MKAVSLELLKGVEPQIVQEFKISANDVISVMPILRDTLMEGDPSLEDLLLALREIDPKGIGLLRDACGLLVMAYKSKGLKREMAGRWIKENYPQFHIAPAVGYLPEQSEISRKDQL